MRCIEISFLCAAERAVKKINRNMRCIEIDKNTQQILDQNRLIET